METIEYYKAVANELREHLEYRKTKPLFWLTSREFTEMLAANRHWKIDEKTFRAIYEEIKRNITQINRSHQEPTKKESV